VQLPKINKFKTLIIKLKNNAIKHKLLLKNIKMKLDLSMIKNCKILILFSSQAVKKLKL